MDLLIAVFSIDPTTITTWPMVAALFIIVGLPTLLTWWGNKDVKKIKTSITENNGGNSVKDRFDQQAKQIGDLTVLVKEHLTWAEQESARTDALIADVSALKKKGVRQRLKQKKSA